MLAREINVTKGEGNLTDKTEIAGIISGSSTTDLIKTGTGVLELTKPNNYMGNTLVQGGTLVVSGSLGVPGADNKTGNVIVGKGAVLAGAGSLYPSQEDGSDLKSVTVNPGGAIRGGTYCRYSRQRAHRDPDRLQQRHAQQHQHRPRHDSV